jgi:hypothetical protein
MPDHDNLINRDVFRATYDSWGQLLVARRGWLERYTLEDIATRKPSFRFDLNELNQLPTLGDLSGNP